MATTRTLFPELNYNDHLHCVEIREFMALSNLPTVFKFCFYDYVGEMFLKAINEYNENIRSINEMFPPNEGEMRRSYFKRYREELGVCYKNGRLDEVSKILMNFVSELSKVYFFTPNIGDEYDDPWIKMDTCFQDIRHRLFTHEEFESFHKFIKDILYVYLRLAHFCKSTPLKKSQFTIMIRDYLLDNVDTDGQNDTTNDLLFTRIPMIFRGLYIDALELMNKWKEEKVEKKN